MGEEKPVMLYLFVTLLLVISLTFIGAYVKSYFDEKEGGTSAEEAVPKSQDPNTAFSSAALKLAGVIFVLMILLFVLHAITKHMTKT